MNLVFSCLTSKVSVSQSPSSGLFQASSVMLLTRSQNLPKTKWKPSQLHNTQCLYTASLVGFEQHISGQFSLFWPLLTHLIETKTSNTYFECEACFLKDIFSVFLSLLIGQLKDWTEKLGERENDLQQRATGWNRTFDVYGIFRGEKVTQHVSKTKRLPKCTINKLVNKTDWAERACTEESLQKWLQAKVLI